jgi:hypothetical protein
VNAVERSVRSSEFRISRFRTQFTFPQANQFHDQEASPIPYLCARSSDPAALISAFFGTAWRVAASPLESGPLQTRGQSLTQMIRPCRSEAKCKQASAAETQDPRYVFNKYSSCVSSSLNCTRHASPPRHASPGSTFSWLLQGKITEMRPNAFSEHGGR